MRVLLLAQLANLALLAGACSERGPYAEARRIESLDQAIGGPLALARVGDYLLENDQIRVVVEGGRSSRHPLDVGGSIIDADLNRPEARYRGGRGLDQLGQIMPVVNMYVAQATVENQVRITRSRQGAEVTTVSIGGPILKILDALGILLRRDFLEPGRDYEKLRIYTEHELRPGERILRIRTTTGYDVAACPPMPEDGCNPECDDVLYDDDCECPAVPARCAQGVRVIQAEPLPDRPGSSFLDLLAGDLPRPLGTGRCSQDADCAAIPGATCQRVTSEFAGEFAVCRTPEQHDAGMLLGDMLLLGAQLAVFVPDTGYDAETDIRRLFDKGIDTLARPLELGEVYGVGTHVSYGFSPPTGRIFVPIFGGSFSVGATAGASCRHDDKGCLTDTLVRFERYLSVGEGDVASAREPLDRVRGVPLGTVAGVVTWDKTSAPVSRAEVFAMADPRELPCDGECAARCPAVGGDAELAAMSVEELFAANRCRTPGGAYLAGHAAIRNMARSDPGTDPLLDGSYRMTLPPGRYVLVARYRAEALSALAPITVAEGRTTQASLRLPLPGRLEYTIFDETGRLSPGRVIVGRCLPEDPCQTDAECREGTTCREGACRCDEGTLLPLELGGSRFADGALTFDQTASGKGTLSLPPGTYQVVFAHGPHATIDEQTVTVTAGFATQISGQVLRAVDRSGWTPSDFHVHATNSFDSSLPLEDRVTSFLAEDMEFLSSSDHDVLTRYQPVIESMGRSDRLGSHVGVEVTTQEIGHFIGYPLLYREWLDGERVPGNGAPDWRGLPPADIFQALRDQAAPGAPMIVHVAHPYTYFDFYRLDPVSLEPQDSILTVLNSLVSPGLFSAEFDTMELANAKSFDLLRRPTIGELRFYSQGIDALLARQAAGTLDDAGYQRAFYNLSAEMTRRSLHRTAAEQEAALAGLGADSPCRCGSDGDCAAGLSCDPIQMICVPRLDFVPPRAGLPPADGLCRSFRGTIDDWFAMLNRGVRRTGVSGSDVHGLYGYEAGIPRTLLATGGTSAPYVESEQITTAILEGRSIVTNGPMIHFEIDGKGVGDTVTGGAVTLGVRIERAPWYDVDRLEIYRNGELIHWVSGCEHRRQGDAEEPHGHPCLPVGEGSDPVYELSVEDRPAEDAWYVVTAMGLDGRTLAPVYASATLPRLGTFEITQKVYDLIPILTQFRTPRFPSLFPTFPWAITNPIWVDVDGNGWTPPDPVPPSWCSVTQGDHGCE